MKYVKLAGIRDAFFRIKDMQDEEVKTGITIRLLEDLKSLRSEFLKEDALEEVDHLIELIQKG